MAETNKDGVPNRDPSKEGGPSSINVNDIFRSARARVDLERGVNVQKMRTLMECSTAIVTDPAEAPRFAERHAAHVRTLVIAENMYRAYYGTPEEKESALAVLANERTSADQNGVFVFDYSTEHMRDVIGMTYPNGRRAYIVAEATGSHPDKTHARYRKPAPSADAQIRLPEESYDAEPVFTVPLENDVPIDKVRLQKMAERPHVVAQIEDLASDPDMGRIGAASFALDTALRELARTNPDRGPFAIEIVTAEIIMITGIGTHDGIEHFLGEEIPGTPIDNQRSKNVFRKFNSDVVTPFRDVVTLLNRKIPVHGHPRVAYLLADWNVIAADVRKP